MRRKQKDIINQMTKSEKQDVFLELGYRLKDVVRDILSISTEKEYQCFFNLKELEKLNIAYDNLDSFKSKAENKMFDLGLVDKDTNTIKGKKDLTVFYCEDRPALTREDFKNIGVK